MRCTVTGRFNSHTGPQPLIHTVDENLGSNFDPFFSSVQHTVALLNSFLLRLQCRYHREWTKRTDRLSCVYNYSAVIIGSWRGPGAVLTKLNYANFLGKKFVSGKFGIHLK